MALGLAVSFRDNVLEDFLAAMGGDIDMPLYGLARAARAAEATGPLASATGRLGREVEPVAV